MRASTRTARGNPRTAQILEHEEYLPSGESWFEELRNGSANNRLPWQFTGKELDETGLYYFGARYYNPRNGVWMSPDPARSSLGLYTYALNNPLKIVDPTGLQDASITMYNDPAVHAGEHVRTSADVQALAEAHSNGYKNLGKAEYNYAIDTAADLSYASVAAPVCPAGPPPSAEQLGSAAAAAEGFREEHSYKDVPLAATLLVTAANTLALAGAQSVLGESGAAEIAPETAAEGTLSQAERAGLQGVANEFDTDIHVVGSRAAGKGRGVGTDLPVGKDPPGHPGTTRSDIDLRVDSAIDIRTGGAFSDALKNLGPDGLVDVRPLIGPPRPPVITISPRK